MATKDYSTKHEKDVANILNIVDDTARVVPSSGAPDFHAGDVIAQQILVECKTTTKQQKTQIIEKDFLETIEHEAFSQGIDLSAVAINFGDFTGDNYFILNERDFINMLYSYYKMKEEENE